MRRMITMPFVLTAFFVLFSDSAMVQCAPFSLCSITYCYCRIHTNNIIKEKRL